MYVKILLIIIRLIKMPIEFEECVRIVAKCQLDVLIFSDIYNSIGSYLLSMGRTAYYQVLLLLLLLLLLFR